MAELKVLIGGQDYSDLIRDTSIKLGISPVAVRNPLDRLLADALSNPTTGLRVLMRRGVDLRPHYAKRLLLRLRHDAPGYTPARATLRRIIGRRRAGKGRQ